VRNVEHPSTHSFAAREGYPPVLIEIITTDRRIHAINHPAIDGHTHKKGVRYDSQARGAKP
jgi:hypothetical protein